MAGVFFINVKDFSLILVDSSEFVVFHKVT